MAERSLWTAYIGPPTTYTEGGPVTMGVSFVPSVDGLVTALKWYRGSTGAGIIPQRLALWNRSTGNKIAEVVSPTDNNTVGWKQYDLVTPAALAQGLTYSVTFDVAGSVTAYRHVNGTPPLPDTNLAWSGNMRAYHAGAQNTFPNTVDNFGGNLVDIVFDDAGTGPPPDDPATAADVDAILASWLTLGAGNDHVGQLPNQTYEAITDTDTGLPAILDAVGGFASSVVGLVGGSIQSALDATEDAIRGAGTVTLNALNLAIGAVQSALDATASVMQATADLMTMLAGGPSGMTASTDPGWTTVDSGAFSGPFSVSGQFDRLYVHITTVGGANTNTTFESWEFGSFAWWWCPIYGNMAGRYHTSRAREAALYEPGMRMEGALVVLPADFQGTYEAMRFDG